jgi:hypothetical protein
MQCELSYEILSFFITWINLNLVLLLAQVLVHVRPLACCGTQMGIKTHTMIWQRTSVCLMMQDSLFFRFFSSVLRRMSQVRNVNFFPTLYLVKYFPYRKANLTDRVTTMNWIHMVDWMINQRPINTGPIVRKTRVSYFTINFWHRSFTFNSNKSPTSCNNFSVYYPDVCLQLNMFRAFSRPSSGAQWLQ